MLLRLVGTGVIYKYVTDTIMFRYITIIYNTKQKRVSLKV